MEVMLGHSHALPPATGSDRLPCGPVVRRPGPLSPPDRVPARGETLLGHWGGAVGLLLPDFDTNRYILTGVRGRGSLNCKALWISCLDTWPKILDTHMAKIDLKCPQLLLYFYV